jgi:hypothetical protein
LLSSRFSGAGFFRGAAGDSSAKIGAADIHVYKTNRETTRTAAEVSHPYRNEALLN